MAIKIYSPTIDIPISLDKDPKGRVGIEFSGVHYLSKEGVREVFGWEDKSAVYDFEKGSSIYGVFVDPAGNEAFYLDKSCLWWKKSVIIFNLSEINTEVFKDLSWLEKKILATQN